MDNTSVARMHQNAICKPPGLVTTTAAVARAKTIVAKTNQPEPSFKRSLDVPGRRSIAAATDALVRSTSMLVANAPRWALTSA